MHTQKISRDVAQEASRLYKSVAFADVVRYLEAACYHEMMATPLDAKAEREAIYYKVQALKDIQATLRNLAQEAGEGET